MPDPVLVAIATALAGKAAASLASGGASALRSLVELVKVKFTGQPNAERALQAAQSDPGEANIDRLGAALAGAAEEDPRFDQQLRSLWDKATTELHADRGGVINDVSGTVRGHAVLARDIQGGVSFGNLPRQGG